MPLMFMSLMVSMISKCIAFLSVALLLANCCALGNGCAPAAGAPIAWDGLGTPPTDDPLATEPQPRKPARAKREIIIGPLDAAVAGQNGRTQPKDRSWEQQQAADQDDEAKLKRKLMICQNCRTGESAGDDATGR
jgi:hypothetical protein